MSLDVKVIREIDIAIQVRKPKGMLCPDLDERMLNKIHDLPIAHSQEYLRSEYRRYYFKAKQHYVDEHNKTA